MTSPPDALSRDARALLRAARGGDDIPATERQRSFDALERSLSSDRSALTLLSPARAAGASKRTPLLSRPARPIAWALAALVSTGSLAALAQHGAFERLGTVIERVLGTPTGARSSAAETPPARAGAPSSLSAPMGEEAAPIASVPQLDADASASAATPLPQPAVATPPPRIASPAALPPSKRSVGAVRMRGATLSDSTANEELDLIVAARNALAERSAAATRAAAERHASQFAHGAFSEEREAILALLDCRETGARERGSAFVEQRPGSLFVERIRKDCGLASIPVPGGSRAATHGESPPTSRAPH